MPQLSSALIAVLVLLGSCVGCLQESLADDLYDRPNEIRRVPLKADPLNPQAKREVACFSYPDFLVKQVDFGEVGADRLSIIPVAGGKTPPCRQTKDKNEYVIPANVWSGYFEGVRSGHAIFAAADGINGGVGFMVFRLSDRKKVFEDVAEKGLQSIAPTDKSLTLVYRRVYAGGCSVMTGGESCRDSIAKDTGIAAGSLSSCADGYRTAKEELAKARCEGERTVGSACLEEQIKIINDQKWDEAPTVVTYEVEVVPGGTAPVFKPLSDVLACRPSE